MSSYFAEALINKIKEERDESILETVEIYLQGIDSAHSISKDKFMEILEIYWTYWIQLEDGTYNFQTLEDYIREQIDKYIEMSKKK